MDFENSSRQGFSFTGPSNLTNVDWNNLNHRRCVAASLVKGAYALERDRQENHQTRNQALAPPWWEFFRFEPIHVLLNSDDSSIFGALYKFKAASSVHSNDFVHNPIPIYVVAFRGTLLKEETFWEDIRSDVQVVRNTLQQSNRVKHAIKVVEDMVNEVGATNVWIAGHSLGASIAMLVGKDMFRRKDHSLETYLFNPPFPSAIEHFGSNSLRHGLRALKSVAIAGVATSVTGGHHHGPEEDDPFFQLSGWTPFLFVNPGDLVCRGFLEYFEFRKKMAGIGVGALANIGTRHSFHSLFKHSEAIHLLPSAHLAINQDFNTDNRIGSFVPNLLQAHELNQWLNVNVNCHITPEIWRREDFRRGN